MVISAARVLPEAMRPPSVRRSARRQLKKKRTHDAQAEFFRVSAKFTQVVTTSVAACARFGLQPDHFSVHDHQWLCPHEGNQSGWTEPKFSRSQPRVSGFITAQRHKVTVASERDARPDRGTAVHHHVSTPDICGRRGNERKQPPLSTIRRSLVMHKSSPCCSSISPT